MSFKKLADSIDDSIDLEKDLPKSNGSARRSQKPVAYAGYTIDKPGQANYRHVKPSKVKINDIDQLSSWKLLGTLYKRHSDTFFRVAVTLETIYIIVSTIRN